MKSKALFAPGRTEELTDRLEARYNDQQKEAIFKKSQIQRSINQINQKMERLFIDVEDGNMDSAIAGPRLNALATEKENLEFELKGFENQFFLNRELIVNYLKINQQILGDRTNLLACKRLIDTHVYQVNVWKDDIEVELKLLPGRA